MTRDRSEICRIEALHSYELFGGPSEPDYDLLTELGARLFNAPICLVSLVGKDSQWFKSRHGLAVCSTPREVSFCAHTLLKDDPLVVLDVTKDSRFLNNALVTSEPNIRFYAGAPLIDNDGFHLGAFCIIDTEPRACFNQSEQQLLTHLAAMVMARIQKGRAMRGVEALGGFANATALAVITATSEGRITFWNKAAQDIFGHAATNMIGSSFDKIIPERFREQHNNGMQRITAGGSIKLSGKTVEVTAVRSDGTEFPIEITISSWPGPNGMEIGAQIQDITTRRAREARLEHLAHHDELTGLSNRTGFSEQVTECLDREGRASLLALDLDGFKTVNDSFGHATGDALLQAIAIRLSAFVDGNGVLARIGGDEFALLCPGSDNPLTARALGDSILNAFAEPFHIAGHRLSVGVSIGLAFAPLHASDADELLLRADLALLAAKKKGGRRIQTFDTGMANQLAAERAFKTELRQATERDEWELHYQPQVRLTDGAIIGAEALLRWRHPTRGLILPATFLPVLETHRIASDIGTWVINEACGQLARWRSTGRNVPRIGVNLFAAQFTSGSLEGVVTEALMRHGLLPQDLELEITETIMLRGDELLLSGLGTLREAGVGIALDDFCTGFASLSTLKLIPVSRLKIDRTFVEDICHKAHSAAIVGAITSLADRLQIEVIAEGIETLAQRDLLLELGCKAGQGYLFGKPEAEWGNGDFQTLAA